jgi:hypothetical protein
MSRLKGAESEAMFAYVALKLQWEIAEPLHHSPYTYDFIIRRHSRKWETVQVKTAWCETRTGNRKKTIRVSLRHTSASRYNVRYKHGDFDLLCVVYYDDVWLIPWKKVKNNSTVVISSKKYDAYKMDLNRGVKPKTIIPRAN